MPALQDADPLAAPRGATTRLDLALLVIGLVILWQAGSVVLGREALPSPLASVNRLSAIMADADFPRHAWETARAFLTALAIALVAGLAVGLALGAGRLSGEVAEPVLVALYSIPKITLYPVILFTMNAVRNMRPVYLRAARAMRLSALQTAATIVVPAALPEIVSGFRIGFALTLLGTLIGEMFASQRGIGYMLVKAMETSDTATVMALALLLVVLATLSAAALLRLDRRLRRHAMSS